MLSRSRLSLSAALIVMAAIAFAGANMFKTSAQSGSTEPQVATGQTKAIVALEKPAGGGTRSLAPSAGGAGQNVLTLDLTLVKGDPNAPIALEITSPCADPCPGPQPRNDVKLGQISLFPALRTGESRRVELQLDAQEAATLSGQLSVELKPIVEGRGVGDNAVKVNSAMILKRSQ